MNRDELVAMIRAMAADGCSGSRIADQVGKTRSAVHGLCWREGIKLRNGNRGPAKGTKPKPKPAVEQKRSYTEPLCIWHDCGRPSIKGKPYCEIHRIAICNGIMRSADA